MDITFAYPIRFERAKEGGWVITSRDFPELISQAEDAENHLEVAEGALQASIEGRLLRKLEVPAPTPAKAGETMVTVPVETATKAALHRAVGEEKVSKSELARKIDLDEKEVRRLLDPAHSSKVPRIAEALAAMGKRIQITVVDVVDVVQFGLSKKVIKAKVEVSGKSEVRHASITVHGDKRAAMNAARDHAANGKAGTTLRERNGAHLHGKARRGAATKARSR